MADPLSFVESIMGTTVSLDVDGVPPSLARVLADETFAYLHGIDEQFSTYRPSSEVCLPLASPSPRMAVVLDRAVHCGH